MRRVILVLTLSIIVTLGIIPSASAIAVGDEAPDFTLPEVFSPVTVQLSDYRGDVVVLVFFAWW